MVLNKIIPKVCIIVTKNLSAIWPTFVSCLKLALISRIYCRKVSAAFPKAKTKGFEKTKLD